MDGLKINGIDTDVVFDASLKEREFEPLKKKSIKDSVPFSNEIYDFSAINGEIYYEPRIIKYAFEIIAENEDELEKKKIRFHNFLLTQGRSKFNDPYTKCYYFEGTIEKVEIEEELYKVTFEVELEVYPYMFAEEETIVSKTFTVTESTFDFKNNSSHPVAIEIIADKNCLVTFENKEFTITAGVSKSLGTKLKVGYNSFTVKGESEAGIISVAYREEVF